MVTTYTRPCGCSDCNCPRPDGPAWSELPKCSTCGHPEYDSLMEGGICFHCRFWVDHVQYRKDYPNEFFVINGKSYSVGAEDAKGFRGFGGDRFHIRRNDGTEVITTNLWHQGTVCPTFRHALPDNAVFVPIARR